MDKTSLIEISYRRSRASCVVLDVVTMKSPVDRCTSDRKMRPLKTVPVTVGVTVETWLFGFLLTEDYSEEQALKGRLIDPTHRTCELDCTVGPTRSFGELDGLLDLTRPFGELDGVVGNPGASGGCFAVRDLCLRPCVIFLEDLSCESFSELL
ncbi:hypothetical protein IGI04_019525 [Brassica rapa subsp. trilocularis]|uniref:Uncharacterized protein n=1 Tax=Brassica rapa subsp. trilocularis TaxID=1813537 RepID=A0ABQ7MG36_BRACM|nr:hypothetical protein IGI04_019525 [Brassica rapa subsp. trilocularis]